MLPNIKHSTVYGHCQGSKPDANLSVIKCHISQFEHCLSKEYPVSKEHLVSNECQVKGEYYDHQRSKKYVSNERQVQMSTGAQKNLKLMSAGAGAHSGKYGISPSLNTIFADVLNFLFSQLQSLIKFKWQ